MKLQVETLILTEAFSPVMNRSCWGLHEDSQLNLSMSFGDPEMKIWETTGLPKWCESENLPEKRRTVSIRGQWWLWFYLCYWKIIFNGEVYATGSSSAKKKHLALLWLEGQKLTSVEMNFSTGATRFVFDLGGTLECRRFEKESHDELWLLYEPTGNVLSACGNGMLRHGPGDVPD